MVISLFPRVCGVKVENPWDTAARGRLRCTARLTRPLRPEELERIRNLPATSVEGTRVVHDCRPEEVEEWHTRLVETLSSTTLPGRGASAGLGTRPRRRSPKSAGTPDPRQPQTG